MAGFYGRTGIEFRDELTENLGRVAENIRELAHDAVAAGGEIIRRTAYGYANVSPGERGHGVNGEHMRDEIQVQTYDYPNGVSARIFIDMAIIPYAAHQEFGDRGNAFLSRAVDDTRDDVHETMKSVFSAGFGADGKIRTKVRFRAIA